MVANTNMTQLRVVCVVNFHLASAALIYEVVPAVIKISMKAIRFPSGTGYLFRSPAVNEIDKIVGEKEHVWKICT